MDRKSVLIIAVAVILGAAIGFGASYTLFQPVVQGLQTSVSSLQSQTGTLLNRLNAINSSLLDTKKTLMSMENRSWHLAYSRTASTGAGSNNLNSTIFEIKGDSMRVRWITGASLSSDGIIVTVFYQNGTVLSNRGSSGMYGSYANELEVKTAGMYFVNIRTSSSVIYYGVYIWDYY